MNKKIKVEFEFTELNKDDILKIDDKFFRIIIKEIEIYKQPTQRRVFLKRINDLGDLEMKDAIVETRVSK